MSKFSENFKKYKISYIVTFVVATIVGIGIFSAFFFSKSLTLLNALNALTIATVLLVAGGGLMWVESFGTFDMVAYGFKQMFASFFSRKANKYNDLYSYKQDKNLKRESSAKLYLSVLTSSIIFIIALFVLYIIYRTQI